MPYRFDVRYQITVVEAGKVVDKLRATPFEKHILTLSPSSTPSRLSGKSTLGSSTFLDFRIAGFSSSGSNHIREHLPKKSVPISPAGSSVLGPPHK